MEIQTKTADPDAKNLEHEISVYSERHKAKDKQRNCMLAVMVILIVAISAAAIYFLLQMRISNKEKVEV